MNAKDLSELLEGWPTEARPGIEKNGTDFWLYVNDSESFIPLPFAIDLATASGLRLLMKQAMDGNYPPPQIGHVYGEEHFQYPEGAKYTVRTYQGETCTDCGGKSHHGVTLIEAIDAAIKATKANQ